MSVKRSLQVKGKPQASVNIKPHKKPFRPTRSIQIVTPEGIKTLSAKTINNRTVGWKATGISSLPAAWCPHSFVICSSCFPNGKPIKQLKHIVAEAIKGNGFYQARELMVRSSGQSETMEERGELASSECSPDNILDTIKSLIDRLPQPYKNTVHWLIQPKLETRQKGFLSNELRLKKESRDWVIESDPNKANSSCLREDLAIRTWRESGRPAIKKLTSDSELAISASLKEVAKWACIFESRILFEWVWDGAVVWIVQAQTELPKSGLLPKSLIGDKISQIKLNVLNLFRPAETADFVKFKKLKNSNIYSNIGYKMPQFYVMDDAPTIKAILAGELSEKFKNDISELTRRDLVLRTDGEDIPDNKREMLPRSENLSSLQDATVWFNEFSIKIIGSDLQNCKLCLIAHHFIPSVASAWARAVPRQRVVRIESLWGIPEGLYWYSHDTHEVDTQEVDLNNISTDTDFKIYNRSRYKERCISPGKDGKWISELTDPAWGWRDSISKRDWLVEIATSTRKIAEVENKAVAIMWFIDTHASATNHRVLPWFHSPSEIGSPRAAPRKKRKSLPDQIINNLEDWDKLKTNIKSGKPVERVTVNPVDVNLIRNPQFADELATLSKEKNFVIELSGGILSHAYYILKRKNAQVECVDLFGAEEDSLEFFKIVRDKIPEIIKRKGEIANIIKLDGEALMLALQKKLIEEAFEAHDAKSGTELIGELADLLEVIHALAKKLGVSLDEIESERQAKRERRGGFDKGILLQKTSSHHSILPEPQPGGPEEPILMPTPQTEVEISSIGDLPQRPIYKRVDERQIGGESENMMILELEVNRDLDWKDSSEIYIPIKTKGNHRFSFILHVKREGSIVRIIPSLRHRALEIQQYLPGIMDV